MGWLNGRCYQGHHQVQVWSDNQVQARPNSTVAYEWDSRFGNQCEGRDLPVLERRVNAVQA